jgi:CMP-N-acetylneuraminic acid synthetase
MPKSESYDIDGVDDWNIAEAIAKHRTGTSA